MATIASDPLADLIRERYMTVVQEMVAEHLYKPGEVLVSLSRAADLSKANGHKRISVGVLSRWIDYGWLQDHREESKGVAGSKRLVDMYEVEMVRRTKARPPGRPPKKGAA
ncbi:MAG: hypothetical protein Q8R28_10720 [Dehalococcoidia bacterium]|nr:hypothetical protein [Dehalococcoidia bacterium]